MARKTLNDLEKARALANECRSTQFCDSMQSALSHALKEVDSELSIIQERCDELLETIKYAYNYAVDHDDRWPFDWALYCEMLYRAIKKVEQN